MSSAESPPRTRNPTTDGSPRSGAPVAGCPLAREATLLWMYGEGPAEHAVHVAECADCSVLLAEHEEVAAALSEVVPALRLEPVAPRPRRWRALATGAAALVALAAAALLVERTTLEFRSERAAAREAAPRVAEPAAVAALVPDRSFPSPSAFESELDLDLDALAYDLDSLSSELACAGPGAGCLSTL